MARPPKKISSIRKIRMIIGITQVEMGELLGIAQTTVEKLENEKLKMPRNIADRYYRETGCLIENGIPVPMIGNDEPFTQEAFEEHRESLHLEMEKQIKDRSMSINFLLGLLMESAHSKKSLYGFSEDLGALLVQLIDLNGLSGESCDYLESTLKLDRVEAEKYLSKLRALPIIAGLELANLREENAD